MSERKSYYTYTASGSAFGGFLTTPSSLVVPSQAMAALSPGGGYGSSTCEYFGIKGLLTVGKATTTVQGDSKQSELTVSMEGINLMDVLRVDRLVLHLVSRPDPAGREVAISPAGSAMEGLSIHGKPVDLPSAVDVFDKYPTYRELEGAYAEGALKGLIIEPGTMGALCSAEKLSGCTTSIGDVKATVYPTDSPTGGLRVKDFATIYFGEYRISAYSRRLTMLRVELGCDTSGSMVFGDGIGNGHWEPSN